MESLVVVKLGGSLIKNIEVLNRFFREAVIVSRNRYIILVHGGGAEIGMLLKKFGIVSKFIGGLRFTDIATLEVAEMVLSGKVNRFLTTGLIKNGANAVGISGKDGKSIICKQIKNLGFVGIPSKINKKLINVLMKAGFLPVIAPIAADSYGNVMNVNADTLASSIAASFKAQKLIFLTDVVGVLDKNKDVIQEIKINEINNLIKDQTITGGMIPKIKACAVSVRSGVREVWIANGIFGIIDMKGTLVKR
ncbi:MAG: acetylglutamate kinase [Endomicrobium sp.]|jgi:acetylglutamate kinase|nr:acetylglutamate kinase [Endomicrobium sp.]